MMINIKDLSFSYPEQDKILNQINLKFEPNSINLLFGPTGSGKTTLLKLIAGLYPKYSKGEMSGKIDMDEKTAMLFQDPNHQFAMKTVKEELIFALGNLQVDPAQMPNRIDDALAFCGISSLKNRTISTLSGGEKQKVALAVTVAMKRPVLLLDEPFSNVDVESKKDIIRRLVQLKEEHNRTIIISDHNLSDYIGIADHFFNVQNDSVKPILVKQIKTRLPHHPDKEIEYKIMSDNDPIINLLNFSMTDGNQNLIEPENIDLYPGITYLNGKNGSGKSTFFKALSRLHSYNGVVKILNRNIKKSSLPFLMRYENLVFQNSEDQFLTITINDEIQLAKKNAITKNWTDDRINDLMEELHLDQLTDRVVYSLSGGQKKKLQIIIMLIRDAPILMLDEPFAGLDQESTTIISRLLEDEAHAGKTIIFASHQQTELVDNADFYIELANHRLTYKEDVHES
ncbi:ATP-binding cassette domain-containing protein [Fructilactobacillus fructivorans]|uniref:Duplicated ATPase component YkoD of energizing module of thiamin-regulated ECF transporter for HydroxyMethylPyrimidine n=1 Tax=Fructilactobacillus fructivorans TaxID=1614 RepID=A0A0C1Q2E7_9LACO|nr:ABC transporter ATP-binding protein [Fructilactobacillus fructivorans]KID41993.1 Duplicated ATPase component YkoD of energizing module of thiamin-regulated ECF transporter for HydroxyMethylPyrimidine [Fructilactobacillus fructivorans]MCT0151650.1 ABC transporter ATP-binding protein [Fructilactobacillus fructivorans]MCT2867221.1 ABC transporter ATP-binding protein [Fructilactobacillus fructivorans]MCT2868218.1 ABC transporter ATP-binding protein [Fructilactobacillus fructivorans]MCT2872926.1